MKSSFSGVPALCGTPIFFILFLSLAPLAWPAAERPRSPETPRQASSPLPETRPAAGASGPAGVTATAAAGAGNQARIFADYMSYAETGGEITARGNVRVWYGNATLTAESAEANLQTEVIHAQGQVTLNEAGRQLTASRLVYDLKTRSAQAEGIVFAAFPWYYQGRSVEKIGEEQVLVRESSFTTCNARHPHFHITASEIDVRLGDALTAYNARLYVGTTPLFYFPWFRRSLKDSRPPFSIRVGYNDFEGLYTKIRFNYFLLEQVYGALMLELMQKKGLGYGLDQHFGYNFLGSGSGDISFLYAQDQSSNRERWTAKAEYVHDFSPADQLQLRADYLSDNSFNREYSYALVDSFQQKSYLAYSRRTNAYYLGAVIQDIETWDPLNERYFSSLREVPSLTFSLNSQRIGRLVQPLYLSLSSAYSRTRQAAVDAYTNTLRITPTLTETLALPRWITQPSVSGSLSLPIAGTMQEWDATKTYQASYATNLTLTNKWVNYQKSKPTHLMQTRLAYDFSRRLPLAGAQELPFAGVTTNHLGLSIDYFLGTNWSLQSSTGYNFLPLAANPENDWRKQLDPFTFSGRGSFDRVNLNWQGVYDYGQARITSGNLNANANFVNWNLGFNTSYSYRPLDPRGEHAVLGTLNAGYNFGIGLSASTGLQYDFSQNQLTRVSVNLARDLHCWAIVLGYTQYADGNNELGFGINLKAFPEVRVGSGGGAEFGVGQ